MIPSPRNRVCLIEEVPGVPPDERYFVCGGPFKYDEAKGGYPHFSTKADGEAFLRGQGITDFAFEEYEL
jgi:hypothetical protein